MHKILFILILGCLLTFCQSNNTEQHATTDQQETSHNEDAEKIALNKKNPAGAYGAELALTSTTEISDLLANATSLEGQTVRIKGTVTDVCPSRGCWVDLASGEEQIRVKVTDGVIVFPLSSAGHEAEVEGVVEKIELDHDAAIRWYAHLAEEKGQPFDSSSVTGPMTIWRVQGMGAVISGS